jgi:hypothetical protein
VSESLPESIPFNQQVHQVLSDARPRTPEILRFTARIRWKPGRAALGPGESRPPSRRSGCVSAEPYPPLGCNQYSRLETSTRENVYTKFLTPPYKLPRQHHKNLKSTNLLERLNEEIKRRTLVVRIFPNAAACLRLIRALAVEMHENWIEATRYLNMEYLKEHKKEKMRRAA